MKSLETDQNVAQDAQNRLQITKHSLVALALPQTLMNKGAYNVLPDSLFRQMLIALTPEKVPSAQYLSLIHI